MKKQNYSFTVIYRDPEDKLCRVVVPIEDKDYDSSISYEENVDVLVGFISEEGGLWLDSKRILPWHRIRMIELTPPSSSQKPDSSSSEIDPPKKSNGRKRRSRRSRPTKHRSPSFNSSTQK